MYYKDEISFAGLSFSTSQLDDTEVSFGNVEMQSQPSLQDLPATSVDKNGEDVELHERGTCSPTAESSSSDESTDLAKNNTSSSQGMYT